MWFIRDIQTINMYCSICLLILFLMFFLITFFFVLDQNEDAILLYLSVLQKVC